MKCPTCKQRAASFGEWGHGTTAFRHTCPHCNESLKASRTSIATFIGLLCLLPLLIPLSETLRTSLQWKEEDGRMLFGALMLLTIIPSALLHWYRGSYAKRQGPSDRAA